MTIYLPINERRICLSAVEILASNYGEMAACEASDTQSNNSSELQQKLHAIEDIEWFAGLFKNKLNRYLNHEQEVKISAKLDAIKDKVIAQMDDYQLRSDLLNKISSIFKEIFYQILFENPLTIQQPDHSLSEEDFQIAKMYNYEEYLINKRVSYCYDFAFYQLNEEMAFPYIFNSKMVEWPSAFFDDSVNYLAKWGYEKIKEPSSGDLVIYSFMGKSKHFGIWTHDGNVLSKLGKSVVVKHPIDDVVLGYGDEVSFFHKRVKSLLLNDFIHELDKVDQSLMTFSHPVIHSTFNTLDCARNIVEMFQKMQIKKVFKNSIYNVDYNNELRREVLLQFSIYIKNISVITERSEVIENMKKIVLSICDRVIKEI